MRVRPLGFEEFEPSIKNLSIRKTLQKEKKNLEKQIKNQDHQFSRKNLEIQEKLLIEMGYYYTTLADQREEIALGLNARTKA